MDQTTIGTLLETVSLFLWNTTLKLETSLPLEQYYQGQATTNEIPLKQRMDLPEGKE